MQLKNLAVELLGSGEDQLQKYEWFMKKALRYVLIPD